MLQARHLIILPLVGSLLLLAACKEQVNPHIKAELDPEPALLRRPELPAVPQSYQAASAGVRQTLTINNLVAAYDPLAQELLQQEMALFERKHPGVKIEYSTWQYTPESFYERAQSRTLTDIVVLDAEQVPLVIQLDYAADLTAELQNHPELAHFSPAALEIMRRGDRIYGLPLELHTLALFYNRALLKEASTPAAAAAAMNEEPRGLGAETWPDLTGITPADLEPSRELAQWFGWPGQGYYEPDPRQQPRDRRQQQQQQPRDRRQQQQQRGYYDQWGNFHPESDPRQRRGQQYRSSDSWYDAQQQWEDPRMQDPAPREREAEDETRRAEILRASEEVDEDVDSARPGSADRRARIEALHLAGATGPAAAAAVAATDVEDEGLPADWDALIRLAVKLTNHRQSVFGFAPNLFAREGGREFTQWATQAGLDVVTVSGDQVRLDVRSPAAAEVLQFLKDLHWKYDCAPPPDKCYNENLMRLFAQGKLGMMILPATADTIQRLNRLGMSTADIGIAPLPSGPANRMHLAGGKCIILNAQLDENRKSAAIQYMLFQHDPERLRLREQFYFREQELTGAPRVPLYTLEREQMIAEILRPYRNLPRFPNYAEVAVANIRFEPAYFTNRLYEALALDMRPILERENSDPATLVKGLAADFERTYLGTAPSASTLQRYLRLLTRQ